MRFAPIVIPKSYRFAYVMKTAFRFGKIFLSLVVLIGLLIVLPAYKEKQLFNWQVCFLAVSYLLFFIPTVWRATKLGNSANREENKQVKNFSVQVASLIGVVGLVAVHWAAIYEHFQLLKDNTLNNILFSIMGIILILSGVMLNLIAVKTLGDFLDRLTAKDKNQLVTSGIYAQVRHPIYTSYLLLFIGFCTFLQSWLSLVALTLVCTRWFSNNISLEEEMLLEEFGEDYQAYSQQTKKLIPLVY